MGKKITFAVAGSGKTYNICNSLNPDARNLIVAYTHQNINNVLRELMSAYGKVPQRTEVMTFSSFLYQMGIRPYESLILDHFNIKDLRIKGVTFKEPPAKSILVKKDCWRPNPKYCSVEDFGHYSIDGYFYCAYLSKTILKVCKKNKSLIEKISDYLNRFFDYIYIDEFQDFREEDFLLIKEMFARIENISGFGDYYQHSVSAMNNTGIPYKKNQKITTYAEFIDSIKDWGVEVDTCELCRSRRCPQVICDFIKQKLGIEIDADNSHQGTVTLIENEQEAINIIKNDQIKKLLFEESSRYNFNCINWGYSKGDTYESVCVILTEAFSDLFSKTFSARSIKPIALNKMYVAMSRTSGDLSFIKLDLFNRIKTEFLLD
ncbi:MAG: hypothetical protein VB091_08935 [Christensenella sp.]|nr:hypothetical protein [Christensenella sp.]